MSGELTFLHIFILGDFSLFFFVLSSLCVRQGASSKWPIFDLINTRVSAGLTIAPRYQSPVIRCVLVNYRLIRYYWGGGGGGGA